MNLAPGLKLGPYEITAKLGEGGMGLVFRAKDFHLGRDVALKVLPEGFTSDPERLQRFEREAKLLAQLNHPNIAQIYGFEASGETRALVMELVEGPTLAERLEQGSLPFNESLSVSLQIAQALEEAHEKGIVHRDLKPQNIKASIEGKVKVLDFGLAKAMDPLGAASGSAGAAASASQLAQSPTLTLGATVQGTILGTAAYMAPEQARGVLVDKRADIWAFGVVLWEMLAGRRLFEGELVTDVLANVLKSDVDFAALPAATPAELRHLLRRCLERNPRNRLHDIADARLVLEDLIAGRVGEGGETATAPATPPARHRHSALGAVAALALGVGLGVGWLLRPPPAPALGAGARWALAIPDGLALATDQVPQIALSDDGRQQVAVVVDGEGRTRLLLRSIDDVEPRLLPESEGAQAPFFSPDGAWVGYFRERALLKMSTVGGAPVQIAPISAFANQIRGATWSRDGFVYFTPNVARPLVRVAADGGTVEPVTKLDPSRDERTHRWPQALPDGKAVLFTCDTTASTEFYDDARIEAVIVATGERRVLVEGASQARYAGGDRLVFARGGSLFAVRFDSRTLTTSGAPEPLVQRVATDVSSGAVQFALSPSGAALWTPGGLSSQYELSWIERDGTASPVPIPAAPYNESALSPDARRVALVGGPGGVAELWVADLDRGVVSRLTAGDSVGNPVWSPDGARIAYRVRASTREGRGERIVWRVADGSREAELLLETAGDARPSGFTPDGGRLLYSSPKEDGLAADVYVLPLRGDRTPQLLLGGEFSKTDAVVSPDGRFVAYTSNENGALNVFVRPFPSGEGRWQISSELGIEPRWSGDQKAIFFRSSSAIFRVDLDTRAGFTAGRPQLVVDRVSVAGGIHSYALAPDGRLFTPRSREERGSGRTLYLDLGFAQRLAARAKSRGGSP